MAGAWFERCRALATVLAVPLYEGRVAVAGAMLELARGRFAAGEQLALEGRRALEAAGDRDATWLYVLQMYPVRRAQERLAELEPDLARCADHGGASLLDAALRAEAYGDRGGVAALLSSRHEGLTQPRGGDRAAALAAATDASRRSPTGPRRSPSTP
ncbi:MAG: hypothetical protein E6G10_26295 [Actinobacteria bacterium]|nr:MAG: hypothetical protein E6G10_26295 [Actinomycetota bacterium]